MAIWVQPLSSVFLSSGRIRMFLQCRKGSQPKGFSLEALCYTTFKCAVCIIHLLQQEPRQLSAQFAFQSSTLQLPLGGMIRNDMVHGTSDPHYLVGEQLFARVAAVLETPPQTASYRKSWSWFCYQKWGFSLGSMLYQRQANVTLLSPDLHYISSFPPLSLRASLLKIIKPTKLWDCSFLSLQLGGYRTLHVGLMILVGLLL